MTRAEALGAAQAQWNDYVGTSAADETDIGPTSRGLYEIIGLDPTAWMILSVDIHTTAPADTITVHALDRSAHAVQSHADLLDLADQTGMLPVTAFELVTEDVPDLARSLFRQIAVRLTARGVRDQRLVVVDHRVLTAGHSADSVGARPTGGVEQTH